MDCLINKQNTTSRLTVSRMTEQKKSRTNALQAEMPHAKEPRVEEPLAEKRLIILLSSLPGNFFAEKALVALCMLRNNGKIKTIALLDTGATRYSFVDLAMARCVCDELVIEAI